MVEKDERIRTQDERVGIFFSHGTRFAMRVELAKFQRRQIIVKDLLRIAGNDFKVQFQLPKQFRATRRG
jgi:hypothetical protein